MKAADLYNLLLNQIGKIDFGGFNMRIAEIMSQYIPDKETALFLLKSNKNLTQYFEYTPSITKFVQSFLQKLIEGREIENILDPWANFGQMLYISDRVYPNAQKTGYVLNSGIFDFNNTVKAGFKQEYGNTIDLLIKDKMKYDLIISNLPVGLTSKTNLHGLAKTDYGLQIIIDSLSVLKEDGLLISTVNSSIFYSSNAEKFKSVLNGKGFRIKAIFGSPVKSVNQNASIPFYFIVIEKGIQGHIFLAEITYDAGQNDKIIGNYKKNRNAKDIIEGILLPIDKIKPIPNIIAKRELDLLLKRTGLPLISLSQFGQFKKLNEIEGEWLIINKNPNKKIELGSSKEDLNEQLNYFLQVNTQVIETKYLLELMNSSLGNKILNSFASGSILPILKIKELLNIQFPIDTIQSQRKTIELDRYIKNIESEFQSLRINLWKSPKQRIKIEKIIRDKLKDPKSIEWMEELPFPLASILWGYHSESKESKKVEYLFLFFEGLCEFIDILILSALASNEAFFETTVKHWLKNEQMQDWYVKASFGGWQKLHEKLSKNVRAEQNKEEEQNFITNLFGGANEDYLKMITSKKLITIFLEVNKLRNDFKGHGGISSEHQLQETLSFLETRFYDIKDQLVIGFSNVKLFSPIPKTMDWDEESKVYSTTCRLIKGTRSKFKHVEIQTNKQLSSKALYLLHEDQFSPLEVLPLVQMRETPRTEQDACYFYNRIDGNKVRLVSYHFDKEAELFDPIAPISNVFKILNPFG